MPAMNRRCLRRCISRITGWLGAGCECGISPALTSVTFSPVRARTGTTANGIFARLLPPDRPRCIWTSNLPAIASTIQSSARSAHCGSSPSPADAGQWRRGRASRIDLHDRFRFRRELTMQVKAGDRIYVEVRAQAEPADSVVTTDYYTQLPQIRLTGNSTGHPLQPETTAEVMLDGNDVAKLVECAIRH